MAKYKMKMLRLFFLVSIFTLFCNAIDLRDLKDIYNTKLPLYEQLRNDFDSYKDMNETLKFEYEEQMRELIDMEFLNESNVDDKIVGSAYKTFAPYINFHSYFIARYLPTNEYIEAAITLMNGVIKYNNLNNEYMQTYVLLLARKGEYDAALDFFPKYLEENPSSDTMEAYDLAKDIALENAIISNDVETLQKLYDLKVDLNSFTQNNQTTPINIAMLDKDREESAKFLLEHGVDINTTTNDESLLYNAVENYFSEDFISFLLSKGSNKNYYRDTLITSTGDNPYIYARVFRIGFYSKELLSKLKPDDYENVKLAYSYLKNKLYDDLYDFVLKHPNIKDFEQDDGVNFLAQLCKIYMLNTYELSQKQKGKILEIMKLLITKDADLSKSNKDDKNSFELITFGESFPKEFVTFALIYGEPNKKYFIKEKNTNWTPLFGAIYTKNQEAFDTLIIKAADVNYKDENGRDAFYIAVENGQIQMAKKLIEQGEKIDFENKSKYNPLAIAVLKNDVAMLEYLKEVGFDIKAAIFNRKNLLEFALTSPNKDIGMETQTYVINEQMYKYLFENFKDELKNEKDINYLNLLSLKEGEQAFEAFKTLINMKIVDLKAQKDGFSPLQFLASDEYMLSKVELLVSQKIDINNQDKDGDTPIHQFVISYSYALDDIEKLKQIDKEEKNAKTSFEVQNILKIAGIDENKQMIEKKTASLQMYKLAIKYLVDQGANLNIKDNKGKTPYELALQNGITDTKLLEMLRIKK